MTIKQKEPKENVILRNDFFDGKHSIYRFAFMVEEIYGNSLDSLTKSMFEAILNQMIEELSNLPWSPRRVFLYSNNKVELDFVTPYPLIILNKEDYLTAVNNFKKYVNKIEWFDGYVNPGMFADDPSPLNDIEITTYKILGLNTISSDIDIKNVMAKIDKPSESEIELNDFR